MAGFAHSTGKMKKSTGFCARLEIFFVFIYRDVWLKSLWQRLKNSPLAIFNNYEETLEQKGRKEK
jgi:hypothetical protein